MEMDQSSMGRPNEVLGREMAERTGTEKMKGQRETAEMTGRAEKEEMEESNAIVFGARRFTHKMSALYVDDTKYPMAIKLFERSGMKTDLMRWSDIVEWTEPYEIVFCEFHEKDKDCFENVMDELCREMSVCGRKDYMERSSRMLTDFYNWNVRRDEEKKNRGILRFFRRKNARPGSSGRNNCRREVKGGDI